MYTQEVQLREFRMIAPRRGRLAIAAGMAVFCAVAAVVPAQAAADSDTVPSADSTVGDTVDTTAIEALVDSQEAALVDALGVMYEETFVSDADAEPASNLAPAIDALEPTRAGEEALDDALTNVEAVADRLDESVVIDSVGVEQIGEPMVAPVDADSISVTVDIEVTRHIATDDIDWVEIVPHEMIVNVESGALEDVTVYDLDAIDDLVEESVPAPLMIIPADEPTTATAPVALTATNRKKVADYALKYALNPNTAYKLYPTDCTNFVSQAMLAGGWKEVSHPVVDYKWDNAWWYGGIPTNSWTWSGAENFYRMTKALDRTTTATRVSDLRVGDLLQYKLKTSSTMTHSMVVTAKSGSTIYLSYHSSNTKNKPFSSFITSDKSWFGHHV